MSRLYRGATDIYTICGDLKYEVLNITTTKYHTDKRLALLGYVESFLSRGDIEYLRDEATRGIFKLIRDSRGRKVSYG